MKENEVWKNGNKMHPLIMIKEDFSEIKLFFTRTSAGNYLKEKGLLNVKRVDTVIKSWLKNNGVCYKFGYCIKDFEKIKIKSQFSTNGQGTNIIRKDRELINKIKILFKNNLIFDIKNNIQKFINSFQ